MVECHDGRISPSMVEIIRLLIIPSDGKIDIIRLCVPLLLYSTMVMMVSDGHNVRLHDGVHDGIMVGVRWVYAVAS